MDVRGKVVDKGKSGSPRACEQSSDLVVTPLIDFWKQVLPAKDSTAGTTKAGRAQTGKGSSFHAMFEAPLGTKSHMRRILHNPKYEDGDRLSPEDEMAVRDVLKYHHNYEQKIGAGIAYIKIQMIYDQETRCFWVVRVDGTEIDFSFHKCLKGKYHHYHALLALPKLRTESSRPKNIEDPFFM